MVLCTVFHHVDSNLISFDSHCQFDSNCQVKSLSFYIMDIETGMFHIKVDFSARKKKRLKQRQNKFFTQQLNNKLETI